MTKINVSAMALYIFHFFVSCFAKIGQRFEIHDAKHLRAIRPQTHRRLDRDPKQTKMILG